jgi:16S rRNA processing protein RimM
LKEKKFVVLADQPVQNKGSSKAGEPVFLVVGKFRRPHGIQGEIAMEIITDFPERITKGKILYIGENHEKFRLSGIRFHQNLMLVSFDGLDLREQVSFLTNQLAYVRSSDVPELPEGYYYHHQLLGIVVKDEMGALLGDLVEILETGANDVFVIKKPDGNELLIPAIDSVLVNVDLKNRVLTVAPQAWD